MLIGIKSRVLAIIGSLMPIGMAIAILFGSLDMPANIIDYVGVFLDVEVIIPVIIPYTLELAQRELSAWLLSHLGHMCYWVVGF